MIHRAIATIFAYSINENDVKELYDKYKRREIVFNHLLPFTINENDGANNRPIPSEYYLQFLGQIGKEENPKQHILFDIETHDEVLSEEISQCGLEEVFYNENFKEILLNFEIPKFENVGEQLRAPIYLLVEIGYTGGYDPYTGDSDLDVDFRITGYLDETNLDKVLF